ncbi:MAG: MFS transporter, partial [Solirubrobacterales bacterium]|nr:MFS transporter [Solirubrobacterales bacterium]
MSRPMWRLRHPCAPSNPHARGARNVSHRKLSSHPDPHGQGSGLWLRTCAGAAGELDPRTAAAGDVQHRAAGARPAANGSFAVAGLVSGAYAISGAVSAPVLGGLVDRQGQTRVLIWGAALTAVSLLLDGLLPARTPAFALIALGAATGLSTPPLAACARALLPGLVADPARLRALFALESTALELTFILGPPMALGLGALTSTGAALTISGLLLLVGTLAFAAHPV